MGAYRVAVMHALFLLLGVVTANTTSPTLKQRAVTMVIGDAKRTVPVSQLVNSMYPQRVAGRHQTAVPDPAMVLDLVLSQQRWRRVDKAPGLLVTNFAEGWQPYDCQPAFTVSRTETQWFRTLTYEMGVCFSICLDYPACTTTTPLVKTNTTWGLLLYCGTKALIASDKTVVNLRSSKPDGTSQAVCRNAVDRIIPLPGVNATPGTSSGNKVVRVNEFSRSARPYDDELVLYTPDLWAHWQVPMLVLEKRDGHDTHFMILPAGNHREYSSANPTDIKDILQQVAKSSSMRTMNGAWVVTPRASGKDDDGYVEAAFVVMRPDMGGRWFGFYTYGGSRWSGGFRDVNGYCGTTIKSMWDMASYLNASKVVSAAPPGCTLISSGTDKPSNPGGWYNDVTDMFSYKERLGLKAKCPVLLNINNSKSYATDCSGRGIAFILNQFGGDACQAKYVFTTPVVETGLQSGLHAGTFKDAYGIVRQIGMLPLDMQFALLVDNATADVDGDRSGYYTITDVSLLCSEDDVKAFVQGVKQRAEQRANEFQFNDLAQANIVTAFMQLVFAIIVSWTLADKATDFSQWTWDKLRALLLAMRCVGSKASDADSVKAYGKPVYMVVARFVIYASTVGAAVFSFLTSTTKGVGLSLVDGYPAMATRSLQGLPCANGRYGSRAIGYVESATVYIEQQTWAVALVCAIAFVIVLIQATLEVLLLMKPTQTKEPALAATHTEGVCAAGNSTPATTV